MEIRDDQYTVENLEKYDDETLKRWADAWLQDNEEWLKRIERNKIFAEILENEISAIRILV